VGEKMALGKLIDGKWTTEWTEHNDRGQFQRMPTVFHNWISRDGSSGFKAEIDRYHLYISLGCPWAHRTALLWKLKGLEHVIGLSIVDPVISDRGWQFSDRSGCISDTVNQADYLWEIYVKSDPNYTGRVTVPVLWDKQSGKIVNNESRQIIQMFDREFGADANKTDFYPADLQSEIDRILDEIYQPINNGVYRSGFARSQAAYMEAVTDLFAALEHWEAILGQQAYLCGNRLTIADWCLFATLFRFDLAYYGLFKCNLKRLVDFPNLWSYCRQLYQYPGVRSVCNVEHVKQLYYAGLPELNPSGIIPIGPNLNFDLPLDR
jgi:glutathionyl-hydroquinone reductase